MPTELVTEKSSSYTSSSVVSLGEKRALSLLNDRPHSVCHSIAKDVS